MHTPSFESAIEASERRRAEAALRATEERLRTVVTSAPVILFATDRQGVITFAEGRGLQSFGAHPEHVIGRPIAQLYPETGGLPAPIRRALAGETLAVVERRGDRTFETRYAPLWDDRGFIAGVTGVATDISERTRAEAALRESEERYRALFVAARRQARELALLEQVRTALAREHSLPVIFRTVVEAVAAAFGYSHASLAIVRGDLLQIQHQVGYPGPLPRLPLSRGVAGRVARTGEPALVQGLDRDPDYVPTLPGLAAKVCVPLRDSDAVVGVLTVESADPGQLSSEDVRLLTGLSEHISLALGRARLYEELAQARDQALEVSRLKSEFLATMSHEIRTPLNGIIGMAELLIDTPLTEAQHEFTDTIHESSLALLRIIDDILDFSKIEANRLVLDSEHFSLLSTVESAADLLRARAQAKGLELIAFVAPEIPAVLRGDAGRLRQVLLNLLGNAIKFTERGQVVLRAELARLEAGQAEVRISVQDSGIGLSDAAIRRLFQSFTQADGSITRRYGGTGLGLAISKRLVELMGGSIGVNSREGQGSLFWLTLPLERVGPSAAVTPPPELDGLRALVVDANRAHRAVVRRYARSWGMQADGAAGPEHALERLRRAADQGQPYALAVISQAGPDDDSLALARAIRDECGLEGVRLVLLTPFDGHDPHEQHQQIAAAGFAAALMRPIHRDALRETLVRAATGQAAPCGCFGTAAATARPQRLAAPARLLLVEDNPVNQQLTTRQIERLGYRAELAQNGREALSLIAHSPEPFDLILMDCQMPELDGFATTIAIRAWEKPGGRRVPIVAMTANAMAGDREACLEAGMDDYLSKPVQQATLGEMLARWLSAAPAPANARPAPEPQPEPAPPAVVEPPLDRTTLGEIRALEAQGETGLLGELAHSFTLGMSRGLLALLVAIERGDAAQLRALAHRLKGSSASMGATCMATRLAQIEQQCQDCPPETLVEQVRALQQDFARVASALDAELEITAQPAAPGAAGP
ncbi:MAG TPA: response regulator [Roseiflexaceae bacterium]|nr:response regulator [Roseiflexaceae bacterium]